MNRRDLVDKVIRLARRWRKLIEDLKQHGDGERTEQVLEAQDELEQALTELDELERGEQGK